MPELSLGTHLRSRREEVRISQATLAWVARVSRNTVSNLERDAVAEPDDRVLDNVEAALGLDRWVHYDGLGVDLDAILLVEPRIVHRLIEVIEKIKEEDPHRARAAADAYVAFMAAFREAQDDDSRMSAHQALQEEAARFAVYIVPLLDPTTELDSSILAFLQDQGWSPEDNSYSGGSTARVSVRVSSDSARMTEAARVHIGTNEAEATLQAELEELRRRAEIAEHARDIAERQVQETQQMLLHTRIGTDVVRHELARLHDLVEHVLSAPTDSARAFDRLPEDVQEVLKSGWTASRSIVKSPAVSGLKHVVLTVKPDHLPTVDARELAEAARLAELATIMAASTVEHLNNPLSFHEPKLALCALVTALRDHGYVEISSQIEEALENLPTSDRRSR